MNNLETIDVVVLCGGLGTRLSSVLTDVPKPMAPVSGKPFLEYVIDHIASFGFTRFILCVGHKAEIIKSHFEKYRNLTLEFSEEKELLGTAGALALSSEKIRSDTVVAVNGDSICYLDYRAFVNFHQGKKALISLGLVKAGDRIDGGFIELEANGRIKSFNEKLASKSSKYINSGVYIFERQIMNSIPKGRKCSLEVDIMPKLLSKGVYGYLTNRELYDIGTPERLKVFRNRQSKLNLL